MWGTVRLYDVVCEVQFEGVCGRPLEPWDKDIYTRFCWQDTRELQIHTDHTDITQISRRYHTDITQITWKSNIFLEAATFGHGPTVWLLRLETARVGGEVARATTVVNFKPNASFPMHQHVGGEDSLHWSLRPQYDIPLRKSCWVLDGGPILGGHWTSEGFITVWTCLKPFSIVWCGRCRQTEWWHVVTAGIHCAWWRLVRWLGYSAELDLCAQLHRFQAHPAHWSRWMYHLGETLSATRLYIGQVFRPPKLSQILSTSSIQWHSDTCQVFS